MKTTTGAIATLLLLLGVLGLQGCFRVTDPLAESDGGAGTFASGTAGTVALGTAGTVGCEPFGADDVMGCLGGSAGFAGGWAGSGSPDGWAGSGSPDGWAGSGAWGTAGTGSYGGCELQFPHGTPVCYSHDPAHACVLGHDPSGQPMCLPGDLGCASWYYDYQGNMICGSPVGGGSAGTSGGAGIGGVGGAGSGGSHACNCDDGNPCTLDSCDAAGTCVHESFATTTDRDADGYSDGCDCDDSHVNVHPLQTSYFPNAFTVSGFGGGGAGMGGSGSSSFDYDCNGYHEARFGAVASTCEVLFPDVCLGDGWDAATGVPACGDGGAYQVCQYDPGTGSCSSLTIMLQQTCR